MSENVIDETPPYALVDCVDADQVTSDAPGPVTVILLNVKSPAVSELLTGVAPAVTAHSDKPKIALTKFIPTAS